VKAAKKHRRTGKDLPEAAGALAPGPAYGDTPILFHPSQCHLAVVLDEMFSTRKSRVRHPALPDAQKTEDIMHHKTFTGQDASVLLSAVFAALLVLLLGACAYVPPFNQYSWDETARLKAESLDLIQSAQESNKLHEERVQAVLASVHRAYVDANLRYQNQESMRQWAILLDPKQPSLAGGIRLWQANDTLSKATIAEFKKLVAMNFDQISKLEGKKRR
jgi:hypothetical protein